MAHWRALEVVEEVCRRLAGFNNVDAVDCGTGGLDGLDVVDVASTGVVDKHVDRAGIARNEPCLFGICIGHRHCLAVGILQLGTLDDVGQRAVVQEQLYTTGITIAV